MQSNIPSKLEFVLLSGPSGSSYALRLEEGKLSYVETPPDMFSSPFGVSRSERADAAPGTNESFLPDENTWRKFKEGMDQQKVWEWRHHYDDASIMHGVQWSLHVIWGDLEARSGGSNAFPAQEDGVMGYSEAFKEFLGLIRSLVREDSFGGI